MLGVYRRSNKGLIGVDISSTKVKILELSLRNGRYSVESYALVLLEESAVIEKNIVDAEAVADAIEKAIEHANPSTVKAAFAIPTSTVIHKIIEMDEDMRDDEREVQIRMEAEQYIPFPLEDVSLDFEVLPEPASRVGRVNVLLVATRTDNVDDRHEALIYAGLTPIIADVESYAIERTFGIFEHTLPLGSRIIALLDIGSSMSTLSVIQDGKIIYTREHVFGGKQLTHEIQQYYGFGFAEAEHLKRQNSLPEDYQEALLNPFMESIAQQAQRSLQLFFASSNFKNIDHILLAGGTANLSGLEQFLQQALGYRVSVANPFLQMDFAAQVDQDELLHHAASLMVACGLALRSFD
ncbi:MAG: pilus assembly protein PilM [Acinetobacter sp.]